MKKIVHMLIVLMLWVSPSFAEQAGYDRTGESKATGSAGEFDGRVGLGYRWIDQQGNPIAGEYDYNKSSAIGALDLEWDPLPHRVVVESYFLNNKDYFGQLDYAYKDIVVFDTYTRGLFHNLSHYVNGASTFTDTDPDKRYGIGNQLSSAFVRFKTPDFPFHLYADVKTIDREGEMQQRFLRAFTGGPDIVSQSRNIDWNSQEVRVGANSHLGPLEADYSHSEKKFESIVDSTLFDVYTSPAGVVPHNLTPELKSSSDTVKVHTSYSGRMVLAGTYTSGDKKNEDSGAKVKYWNAGGDLMFMPVTSVVITAKYRHYDLDVTNPETTILVTPISTQTVTVRPSLGSSRDVATGTVRYRVTDRMTVRGEYVAEAIERTNTEVWDLPQKTTKGTAKLNLTYRVMNRVTFKADYSRTAVGNPAYDTDPDRSQSARAALTWMPSPWVTALVSYGTTRETRDNLGAPLGGGSRDADRDQALASVTVLVGNRSSVTASYSYFRNKVDQTLSLNSGAPGPYTLAGVPYADISHAGSLVFTVAPMEGINITASGTRSYSRGNFDLEGTGAVTNTSGIADLSDMKVVDSVYAAGIEMQHSRYVSSEVRYQYRRYEDILDSTQDGKEKAALAMLSMKW